MGKSAGIQCTNAHALRAQKHVQKIQGFFLLAKSASKKNFFVACTTELLSQHWYSVPGKNLLSGLTSVTSAGSVSIGDSAKFCAAEASSLWKKQKTSS